MTTSTTRAVNFRVRKANDFLPRYFKVQTAIKEDIENGKWKPSEVIPPERKLAETYQVSIGTIKKALLDLTKEGYLYRIQGKGTFVAGGTLRWEGLRYYRTQRDFFDTDHDFNIKFIEIKEIDGPESINRILRLPLDQKLWKLRRFIIIDSRPVVYTISYLPQSLFKNLNEFKQSRFEKLALYLALEESYGLPNVYNQELIGLAEADTQVSSLLNVNVGAPLLFIEMIAYTYKETPYEYRKAYFIADTLRIFREY